MHISGAASPPPSVGPHIYFKKTQIKIKITGFPDFDHHPEL
jgi:hypothetical protein